MVVLTQERDAVRRVGVEAGRGGQILQSVFHLHNLNLEGMISSAKLSIWRVIPKADPAYIR